MHGFNKGEEPEGLSTYRRKNLSWDDFSKTQMHALVRDTLYDRQDHYCAYCEVQIKEKYNPDKKIYEIDGHIEHLEKKSINPSRTYDWDNLFFSCMDGDSCGKYKDQKAGRFNIDDIVDPAKENPRDYFQYDEMGGIFPRVGLSPAQKQKAKESIRVFHLDCIRLTQIRAAAAAMISPYINNPDISEDTITDLLASLGNANVISVYYDLLGR